MSRIKHILDTTNPKEFAQLRIAFEAILDFVHDYMDDINSLRAENSEYQIREINHAINKLVSGSRSLSDNCAKLIQTPENTEEWGNVLTAAFSNYVSCKSAIEKLEPMIEKIEQDEHDSSMKI